MDASGDPIALQPAPTTEKLINDLCAQVGFLMGENTRLETKFDTAQSQAVKYKSKYEKLVAQYEKERKKNKVAMRSPVNRKYSIVNQTFIAKEHKSAAKEIKRKKNHVAPLPTSALLPRNPAPLVTGNRGPNCMAPLPINSFPPFHLATHPFGGHTPAPALPNLMPSFTPIPLFHPAPMAYGNLGPFPLPPTPVPQINSNFPTPVVYGHPGPMVPRSSI